MIKFFIEGKTHNSIKTDKTEALLLSFKWKKKEKTQMLSAISYTKY